ncbi:MAG: energy transducer TonB [bacterium]|nr:energy transducer TonB [bacterium]
MKCIFFLFITCASTCFAQAEDETFFPEVEAMFPGGAQAIRDFIDANLRNPLTPKDQDCKVYVSFVVRENGELTDLKVEKGCSPLLDEEALRIYRIMPRWIPGQLNGTYISTRCRMPIPFYAPSRKEWRKRMKN